jgi:hypothetical protein
MGMIHQNFYSRLESTKFLIFMVLVNYFLKENKKYNKSMYIDTWCSQTGFYSCLLLGCSQQYRRW